MDNSSLPTYASSNSHEGDTVDVSAAETNQPDGAKRPDDSHDTVSHLIYSRKVALVTGSGSGIGASIALDLVTAGYHVIVTGRTEDKLRTVAEQCNNIAPSSASTFVLDFNDLRQVDRMIQFVRLKFNRLDLLVNNVCWRGEVKNILDEGAYEDLQGVMHLNVSVPTYLTHRCLIPLRGKDPASTPILINISSIAGQQVVPLHLYSISKACMTELTRQIAHLSHDLGVLSVTISPGPVLTPERPHHSAMRRLTLLKRVAYPREISNFVMFVIENPHLFNGQDLVVDGGCLVRQQQ